MNASIARSLPSRLLARSLLLATALSVGWLLADGSPELQAQTQPNAPGDSCIHQQVVFDWGCDVEVDGCKPDAENGQLVFFVFREGEPIPSFIARDRRIVIPSSVGCDRLSLKLETTLNEGVSAMMRVRADWHCDHRVRYYDVVDGQLDLSEVDGGWYAPPDILSILTASEAGPALKTLDLRFGCEECHPEDPSPRCKPIVCHLWCPDGFERNEHGCAICKCRTPSGE